MNFVILLTFILPILANYHLGCPRSTVYWSKHNAVDSGEPWPLLVKQKDVEFTEMNLIMNGSSTWYDIITQTKDKNLCRNAAGQWISYMLNFRNPKDYPEANGQSYELSQILENTCKRHTVTSSLSNHVIRRLSELNNFFTAFNSDAERENNCILYHEMDCNDNKIRDTCEADNKEMKFICSRGNFQNSIFQNCKLDGNLTNQEICGAIMKGRDCNKNKILDQCEITSKSPLSCENKHCWFVPDGEKIPYECSMCKSLDIDRSGVPDICEDPVFKDNFLIPVDCNQNFIEDDIDILMGTSLDTNGNGKPDECEIGYYCDTKDMGYCKVSSLKVSKEKGQDFKLGKICSQVKDCDPVFPGDVIGSCCRRTSAIDAKIVCEDNVKKDYCLGVLGGVFNKNPICGNHTCNHLEGSCCKTDGDMCFKKISLKTCRSSFLHYTFDLRHDCKSLCSPPNTTIGTCVLNAECVMDIKYDECKNLRGIFDYIPCGERRDIKPERKGSCCWRDRTKCQDLISEFDCVSKNGKFSTKKCHEEDYCLDADPEEDLGDCCWDEENLDCERTKGDCQHQTIKCASNPFCRMLRFFPQGCCMLDNQTRCMKLTKEIDQEHCSFFSGTPLDHSECVKKTPCLLAKKETPDVDEIEEAKKKTTERDMRLEITEGVMDDDKNITGPQTIQTTEQIASTTVFLFIAFFVVFLFVVGGLLLSQK